MTSRTQVGVVFANVKIHELTMSVDTSAYADGDLLADVQQIANFSKDTKYQQNRPVTIVSLELYDAAAQGTAMDVFFTPTSTTWGTENSAPSAADAVIEDCYGPISVVSTDWVPVGSGISKASMQAIGLMVEPAADDSIYVAIVSRGTPTFGASTDLKIKVGVLAD